MQMRHIGPAVVLCAVLGAACWPLRADPDGTPPVLPAARPTSLATTVPEPTVTLVRATSPAPPRRHRGTIYYINEEGVWKYPLSRYAPVLLAGPPSFTATYTIVSLVVSPDDKWLALVQGDPTHRTPFRGHSQPYQGLSVVSTGGGKPVSIIQSVPTLDWVWLTDSRLVYGLYPNFREAAGGQGVEWGVGNYYIYNPQVNSSLPVDSPPLLTRFVSLRCSVSIAPGLPLAWLQICPSDNEDGYLRLVQIDNSQPVTITAPFEGGPVQWLPDGDRLFFTRQKRQQELHVWGRASREEFIVTIPNSVLWWHPVMSPDGRWVAFLRSEDRSLCVRNLQRNTDECYLKGFVRYFQPWAPWSPDSQAIVIATDAVDRSKMRPGGSPLWDLPFWDVFIISIPERRMIRLTQNEYAESNVSWGR